jgi:hypothetical protein
MSGPALSSSPAFPYRFHDLNCLLKLVQLEFGIVKRKLKGTPRFDQFNGTYADDTAGKLGDCVVVIVVAIGGVPLAIEGSRGTGFLLSLFTRTWHSKQAQSHRDSGLGPAGGLHESHPATAPAGSNRSSHGDNEVAEAFLEFFSFELAQ